MGILQAKILEWVVIPPLQGIFPTQGSSPGLPHCRWILCHLSHQGSLEARRQSLLSQILHVAPTFGSGASLQWRAIEPIAVNTAGLWGSLGPDWAPEWRTAVSTAIAPPSKESSPGPVSWKMFSSLWIGCSVLKSVWHYFIISSFQSISLSPSLSPPVAPCRCVTPMMEGTVWSMADGFSDKKRQSPLSKILQSYSKTHWRRDIRCDEIW